MNGTVVISKWRVKSEKGLGILEKQIGLSARVHFEKDNSSF
jgi:hypothetical protein